MTTSKRAKHTKDTDMKKTLRIRIFIAGTAALGAIAFSETTALADKTATVVVNVEAIVNQTISQSSTKNLNFGTIELDPATGDETLTINASTGATTTPTAGGGSVVSGSPSSGEITIVSPINFTITANYPDTATLTSGGNTLTVSAIPANSEGETAPVAHTGGTDTVLDVGGILTLPDATVLGTYTGTISVDLTYQ